MSSKRYATPLRLEIGASKFLFCLLLFLHLASLTLLYFLPFNLVISIFVAALIIFSGNFIITKYALLTRASSIVKLVWEADNQWILETKGGISINADLLAESYLHPSLTILIFRPESESRSGLTGLVKYGAGYQNVILFKDNIDEKDFRRLRVRLKVGRPISGY